MLFVRSVLALLVLSAVPAKHVAPRPIIGYQGCHWAGGPNVVELTPLPRKNRIRSAKTRNGLRQIKMVDGIRIAYAYPATDFFANVKVEELPASTYSEEKQDLLDELSYILGSSDESVRNYDLKPTLAGFQLTGIDRVKLEGGVLGIYLFFDDATHVATTIYFLNADPERRKFDTLAAYTELREQFLQEFTRCARAHTAKAH